MAKPLPLRTEQPQDDLTVVIRAGVMAPDALVRAAERTFEVHAIYGISVEGVLDGSVLDACRSPRVVTYRQVRLSTFGTIRGAGFALLATFDRPHFTLVLADLSEVTVRRLGRCFGDPIPNPGRPTGL